MINKKVIMKNFILILSLVVIFVVPLTSISQKTYSMPNPWINCEKDIGCAAQKAGFNFQLKVEDYQVRAMYDMIEFIFPIEKNKIITLRKTIHYNGMGDISGIYENYPVNKTLKQKDGTLFRVRGDKSKYYVVNFALNSGYYSAYSNAGITNKNIKKIYKLIKQSE